MSRDLAREAEFLLATRDWPADSTLDDGVKRVRFAAEYGVVPEWHLRDYRLGPTRLGKVVVLHDRGIGLVKSPGGAWVEETDDCGTELEARESVEDCFEDFHHRRTPPPRPPR